jgi:hypothetical protein
VTSSAVKNFDWSNPDYLPIFKDRYNALKKIRSDQTGRVLRALKSHYKTHVADYIQDWFVTYDPRNTASADSIAMMPFILFPKQREYIEWLDALVRDYESGLVEKSRDGGYTWLSCAWSAHRWDFYPGTAIGFGSRKEALVDEIGMPDSIMEKIRIILRFLPAEFRPDGYNERQHARFMKILHPFNGSSIAGEAGDNIGRGGRKLIYFKDESAHYERAEMIEAALSENTVTQVDISSVNGEGNIFHRRRHSGEVRVFIHDWRDDPRKDQDWYDKKRRKAIAEGLEHILAQEVDRDYASAVTGVFIPAKWVKAAIDFEVPVEGIRVVGLDPDDEGRDGKAMVYRHGVKVLECRGWKKGDTTETAREAWNYALLVGAQLLNFDAPGVGAGIKGETNSLTKAARENGAPVVRCVGVFTASKALPGMYEDTDRKNADLFENLRSKIAWGLRRRFEKTYEVVTGIAQHPWGQLISIPNDPELISELSRPKRETSGAGKILLESKKNMRGRGIPSPNKFDALGLAFHDPDELKVFAWA